MTAYAPGQDSGLAEVLLDAVAKPAVSAALHDGGCSLVGEAFGFLGEMVGAVFEILAGLLAILLEGVGG